MQDELYAMYKLGKITPHVESTHSFRELPDALADLDARRIIGRSVILMDR